MSSTKTRFVAGDAAAEQHQYVQKHALRCDTAMFAAYMRLLPDKLEILPETLTEAEGAARRTIWWSVERGYLTNIHHDPEVVAAYWPAVYQSERKPSLSTLRLEWHELLASTWHALAENSGLPSEARPVVEAAAAAAEGCPSWRQKRLMRDGIRVDEEVCQEVFDLVARMTETPLAERAVNITRARGGRTQYRLVAELPAELDDVERILIVKEFCESLNALGPMFEAVIHGPDHDNDARNYHLHVIYHDRPADYLRDLGKWDMEVRTPVRGRQGRFKPLRKKVVLGWKKGMTRRQAGEVYLKALRELWAEVNNAALVRARKYPRYDPRTYAEMGIDQEPAEHLDNSAARASLAGVPPAACIRNAERYWSAEWGRRVRRIAKAWQDHQNLAGRASDYIKDHPARAAAESLGMLLEGFVAASGELNQLEQNLLYVDLYEDMLRSRALKTKTAALRLVRAIERGDATPTDNKYGPDIAERGLEAVSWIKGIDELVAPLAEVRRRREELRAFVGLTARRLELLVRKPAAKIDRSRGGASEDLSVEEPWVRKERILETIKKENLAILPDRDGEFSARTVVGLDPSDAAFLEGYLVGPRLRLRFEYQEREIGRLRAYRKKHPGLMNALLVGDEVADDVPQAVKTLLARYRRHPEIGGWESRAIDEAALRDEEADEQLQRERAAAEEVLLAAEALALERAEIESFLTQAKEDHWEITFRDGRHSVEDGLVTRSCVGDLLESDSHREWVQGRFATLALAQEEERRSVLAAIAALEKVRFKPDGTIVPVDLSPDTERLFQATRGWVGISEALVKRVKVIENEAMKEIEPLLRLGFIRISIDLYGVCSVPRDWLGDRHAGFLDRHEKRPLVQEQLLPLGRAQRRLYNELRERIIATSPTPATATGELDKSKLPLHLCDAGGAWADEPEIAKAVKDKLVSELQVATSAIDRIERDRLDLSRTPSGWRFDERLAGFERSSLASSFHAAVINQRLADILKQRERDAERVQERLRQAAEEQRRATEAAAEEQRRAAVAAAEERRRASETAAMDRSRVDALLVQIDTQNLGFDISAAEWNLDPRLSASDRNLLSAAGHIDHVKSRLEQIAGVRQRAAEDAAGRRLVDGLLRRFAGEDLAFNLAALDLGLDPRLDPAERAVLGAPKYRDLVSARLQAVSTERERRRAEEETEKAREGQRVSELLDRIQREGLRFERNEKGGWRLDSRLTEAERVLLWLPIHSSLLDSRLDDIAQEREDIYKEDERRLKEERAELNRALERMRRAGTDFDLGAAEWGIADRVSEQDRRLLCSKPYRPIVEQCLREILDERRQLALEESSAVRTAGTPSGAAPATPEVAVGTPAETGGADDFASVVQAFRNRGRSK